MTIKTRFTSDKSLSTFIDPKDFEYFVKERKIILSTAEFRIAMLIAADLSNKEIAKRLFVSEHTVRRQISSILNKSDLVRSRTGIGIMYVKSRYFLT